MPFRSLKNKIKAKDKQSVSTTLPRVAAKRPNTSTTSDIIPTKRPNTSPTSDMHYSNLETINFNDISGVLSQTDPYLAEQNWNDVDDIINQPSPKENIDLTMLDKYLNQSPIPSQEGEDIFNFINPDDNPPSPSEFNILSKYTNLEDGEDGEDGEDWRDLEKFINSDDNPSSPSEFNIITQHTNLEDDEDGEDNENFINPDDNPPSPTTFPTPIYCPPNDLPVKNISVSAKDITEVDPDIPVYNTIFTKEQIIILAAPPCVIDLANPIQFMLENKNDTNHPTNPYPPIETAILPPSRSNDDNHTSTSPTSDDLFEVLKHISDCNNNKTKFKNTILSILTNDGLDIKNQISNFNTAIREYNKNIIINNNVAASGHTNSLKFSTVKICKLAKDKYPTIYPTKQILELIESSPTELKCLSILENELPLKNMLDDIKKLMHYNSRKPSPRPYITYRRVEDMKDKISVIQAKYKEINNL
ncbi:MAG: hypothetical protein KFW09_04790 [Oscillospiraceae bacterium]|nr:hypothetical protein [Oscillospiraceae bacterium]